MNQAVEKENIGINARKFELGERIQFDDFIIKPVFTKYGETSMVSFADESGTIFRKAFGASGLSEFLKNNKDAKSICLKKKLQDGEFQYNVWST